MHACTREQAVTARGTLEGAAGAAAEGDDPHQVPQHAPDYKESFTENTDKVQILFKNHKLGTWILTLAKET